MEIYIGLVFVLALMTATLFGDSIRNKNGKRGIATCVSMVIFSLLAGALTVNALIFDSDVNQISTSLVEIISFFAPLFFSITVALYIGLRCRD